MPPARTSAASRGDEIAPGDAHSNANYELADRSAGPRPESGRCPPGAEHGRHRATVFAPRPPAGHATTHGAHTVTPALRPEAGVFRSLTSHALGASSLTRRDVGPLAVIADADRGLQFTRAERRLPQIRLAARPAFPSSEGGGRRHNTAGASPRFAPNAGQPLCAQPWLNETRR
jgi:hypothetical protein